MPEEPAKLPVYYGVERVDPPAQEETGFKLVRDHTLLVLPFTYHDARRGLAVSANLVTSPRWHRRMFSLEDAEDVERTEYFLPYIKRFLFPSLYADPDASGPQLSCWHFNFDHTRLGAPTPDAPIELTVHCQEGRTDSRFAHRIRLVSTSLSVFSYGVGFLVLRVETASEGATYFDQMNAATYLRALKPLFVGFELAKLERDQVTFTMPQLVSYLLAEFSPAQTIPPSPQAVPAGSPIPVNFVHDDRLMVLSFSCIDHETCFDDLERCERNVHRPALVPLHTGERRDGPQYHSELVAWADRRWEGFSRDGGAVVCFDTTQFNVDFLGLYQSTYYFDIFMLAALQRVTLLRLFERLSDIQALTTGGRPGRNRLRVIRRDLLLFKNQCWFSQITNRDRGLQLYRRWQEAFDNQTLLAEVNDQAEELDTYLTGRMRERVEALVRLGGFLGTAIPAVLGLEVLLGKNLPWVGTARWILLVALIIGSGAFAWWTLVREEDG